MTRVENDAFANVIIPAQENSFGRDQKKTIDHFARRGKLQFSIGRITIDNMS